MRPIASVTLHAALAAALVAFAAAPASAAGYLKLGDIKGDVSTANSGDRKNFYKGWIELNSWSWGARVTGGGGAGKPTIRRSDTAGGSGEGSAAREITGGGKAGKPIVRRSDTAAATSGDPDQPLIAGQLPNPDDEREAVLASPAPQGSMTALVPAGTCRVGARYPAAELGTGQRVYRMTGVVVTHCSPAQGGGAPMEHLSLNYQKIVWN